VAVGVSSRSASSAFRASAYRGSGCCCASAGPTPAAHRSDERRHLAGRHEADVHDDGEQNEAVVVSGRSGDRTGDGRTVSDQQRQQRRSRFRRAPTVRRLLSRGAGRPSRVVGTLGERRAGTAARVEHGLAAREAVVVSGWRTARVLALRDARSHGCSRGAQHGWQRRASVDVAEPGRDARSDWSKHGQAILGACRFSPSDRYSTCL
jgi:hypothetical protein